MQLAEPIPGANTPEGAAAHGLDRRAALTCLALGVGSLAASGWPGSAIGRAAAHGHLPWLASPQQRKAERIVMQIERDPQVKAIQAKLKAYLAASARARLRAAAATLDNAIAQWTRSLIMYELIKRPWDPVMIWTTDDTSRTWLGHTLGGTGTSGDNPDSIYRIGYLQGGGRYELLGRFHPDSRPTQLLIEVDAGDITQPGNFLPNGSGAGAAEPISASLITDKNLVVAPDGTFRITIGGEADGPNHLVMPHMEYCSVGARDMLADWTLHPCQLTLRRLDKVAPQSFGLSEMRRLVLRDLEGYTRFWADFPDGWMGALKPNTHAEPAARPGGWGFVAGLNFHLAPDEALLVTLSAGEARYTGFQINDPWMIAPDARTRQVCLNNTQATANPDGTVTYVIARNDPGAANWLDTAGMDDGIGIMRWQQVPPTMSGAGLFRDFRVVKLAEVAAMKSLPSVTPQQRRAIVAARAAAYNTRVG